VGWFIVYAYLYLRELGPDQTKRLAIKDPTRRGLDSDHCHVVKKCGDFVVRIIQNPKLPHLEVNPLHAAESERTIHSVTQNRPIHITVPEE